MRHQVTFTAAATDGGELFTLTLDAASLSNRAVTLFYEPEAVQDQKIIHSYGGLDNTPAYLVRLRPALRVEGERLTVGRDGLPMGADYTLTIGFSSPNGQQEVTSHHIIGNLASFGIVSQQVVPPAELPPAEKDAERLLHEAALSYIDHWNRAEEELSAFLKVTIARPLPTVVTVGGVLDVDYLFDTPHAITWKGLFIDASLRRIEAVAVPGQEDRNRQFMRLSALAGSVLEHRLFEEHFQVDSISTAKLLALARQASIPLLTLDGSNAEALLPTFPFADNVKTDMTNAIHQGFVVIVPEDEITHKSWAGIGYIKENPTTGEAGYMLSGVIAGGMTAEEWAEGYLKEQFNYPYTSPPNRDPAAAAQIVKIPVGDRQNGIAGQKLAEPLAVLVTDLKGRPVAGAPVTFTILAGGGAFDGAQSLTTQTAATGIAKAWPLLGASTADNPSFQMLDQADVFATQVGVNLITAAVTSRYGELAIPQPFEAYGRPDAPVEIVKLLGEGNKSLANNPAGSLSVKVIDRHGNPVSNIPVTFSALAAVSQEPLMPLPPGFRNIELYRRSLCASDYPLPGECTTPSSLSLPSAHFGANVETLLGNTVNTRYAVEVSAPGLPAQTFTLYSLGYMQQGDYLPPQLFILRLETVNEKGEAVNAAKAGQTLKSPLSATLLLAYNDHVMDGPFQCSRYDAEGHPYQADCWTIKGSGLVNTRKMTEGEVAFTPTAGGGSTSATQHVGEGRYRTTLTTGAQPALNVVEALGEATVTVPEVYDGGALGGPVTTGYETGVLPLRTVTLTSGQAALFNRASGELRPLTEPRKVVYEAYGVDVSTAVSPAVILLGENGMARDDVAVAYVVLPSGDKPDGYAALSAQVDLFSRDAEGKEAWAGYLVGNAVQGPGTAVFSRGTTLDPARDYFVQTVLNRGTDVEIRGEKVALATLRADLAIDSDNNAGTRADGTHNDPARNPLEEQAEDLPGAPGKVLQPNLLDVDGDQVPGFADGIDLHGNEGEGVSAPFVPLLLEVGGSVLDPAAATVRFAYPGSDPAGVQRHETGGKVSYIPAAGSLRLWAKDGRVNRKVADLAAGGDYVRPHEPYPLGQLGPPLANGSRRLYIEAVRSGAGIGSERIVIHIDPDGAGPLPEMEADAVRTTPLLAALVPDYDHDRKIDEKDKERAARGDTFYFWINDDDDEGETEGSDIPGEKLRLFSSLDGKNDRVDGVRDLIDFFPVALDIQPLLDAFPPGQYAYRLKTAGENLNVLFPDLDQTSAGDYLTNVDTARRIAALKTYPVSANGVFSGYGRTSPAEAQQKLDAMLRHSRETGSAGILLLEGSGRGQAPLLLEISEQTGQPVFTASLNLSMDGVEQMFRHLNLIASEGGPPAGSEHGGPANRFLGLSPDDSEPSHYPQSETDPQHHFIFIHGYNVNGQQARGWHAEMFKRLYWSGSRAQFWGISWYGFETQGYKPGNGNFTPNFHLNIIHALNTAQRLNEMLPLLIKQGNVTLAAHSLGNAAVVSLLSDHYTNPQNPNWTTWADTQARITDIFMINAAVALEALDGGMSKNDHMNHPRWWDYQEQKAKYHPGLWSSEWHRLFNEDEGDARSLLTWRDRFAGFCPTHVNCYNFFSSGEEVLATQEDDGMLLDVPTLLDGVTGRYSFALQEKLKGEVDSRMPWIGMDGGPSWKGMMIYVAGSPYGGWGINRDYEVTETVLDGVNRYPLPPEDAESLYQNNKDQFKTQPFFKMGSMFGDLFDPATGSSYAQSHRDRLLAEAFPALTLPAGGPGGGALYDERVLPENNVVNMQSRFKNSWPFERLNEQDDSWRHSDIREIAYPFVKDVFLKMLKQEE